MKSVILKVEGFLSLVLFVIVAGVISAPPAQAVLVNSTHSYYGEDFYAQLKDSRIKDKGIVNYLKKILRGGHIATAGQFDQIFDNCTSRKGCYEQTPISYAAARVQIFGNLYLEKNEDKYFVKEVYCNLPIKSGPNEVPPSTVANVEHTWPQSKFTRRYPEGTQKADLHHLFPTDSQLNSSRSSYRFGEVSAPKDKLKCNLSMLGSSASGKGGLVFEPPPEHRGNVARAIFYFATRYDMVMDKDEEAVLRKWHHDDPVDQDERERNDKIFLIQKNRNPFVDHPEIVDQVQAL